MKKNKEFSKKIFDIVIFIYITVMIFSMALMWKTESTDALSYLIPSITGLAATTVGFYYWKAKMENKIKLMSEYKMNIDEINDIEEEIKNESGD